MKYRFAVELDFDGNAEDALALLAEIVHRGMRAFGHTNSTLPIKIEKMRQHKLDLDKPVGEKQ